MSRNSGEHPVKAWARGKMSQKGLCRELGVSMTALHYWDVGVSCPAPKTMAAIERVTAGRVTASDCVNYFMEKAND